MSSASALSHLRLRRGGGGGRPFFYPPRPPQPSLRTRPLSLLSFAAAVLLFCSITVHAVSECKGLSPLLFHSTEAAAFSTLPWLSAFSANQLGAGLAAGRAGLTRGHSLRTGRRARCCCCCRPTVLVAVKLPLSWLLDGYSHIFRSYVFGPSGSWTMTPLDYAAKFDPFLSLDCAPTPSTLVQSKEREGSDFAIWKP